MSSDLFTFGWPVPSGGFRWVDAGVKSSDGHTVRVLVEQHEAGLAAYRRYDPLIEDPALYRSFADTPPTEEGIITFADRWGALGEWDVITGTTPMMGRKAELFTVWVHGISEMRQAVWIWDRLTSQSREVQLELRRHLWWERDGDGHTHVIFDSHPQLPRTQTKTDDGYSRVFAIVASDQFGDEGLSQFIENDLAAPARDFLYRLVNRNLRGRVSPRLVPGAPPPLKSRLAVLASLQLAPTNLLACLWLQLAQVVSGLKAQRQCLGCRKWFEAAERRTDKLYCGDACRKQAHQEKRLLARRLHAAGKKVTEIAKELGADMAMVKKWIISSTKG
jgi:hypothetical protein